MTKIRNLFVKINEDEIKKIYENKLGGILINISILHSRIDLNVNTEKNQEINLIVSHSPKSSIVNVNGFGE